MDRFPAVKLSSITPISLWPWQWYSAFLGLHFIICKRRGRHSSSDKLEQGAFSNDGSNSVFYPHGPLLPGFGTVLRAGSSPTSPWTWLGLWTTTYSIQNGCGEVISGDFRSKGTKPGTTFLWLHAMKKFGQPKKKKTEGPQPSAQLSSSTHWVDRKARHSSVPNYPSRYYRDQTNLYWGCPKASKWATCVVNVLSHQAPRWPVIQQWWPEQEHKGRLQNDLGDRN